MLRYVTLRLSYATTQHSTTQHNTNTNEKIKHSIVPVTTIWFRHTLINTTNADANANAS